MSRFLKSAVAALALGTVMSVPVAGLAQTAAPAPANQATTTTQLPKLVQDLGLSDLKTRDDRHGGQRINGKLADGTKLHAFTNDKGDLLGARVEKGQALPATLVQQILPEAVRTHEVFQHFATISGAFGSPRGVMVGGSDANGEVLRAAFSQDGTLMRYGRGEDVKPHMDRADGKARAKHKSHRHEQGERSARRGKMMMPLSDQAVQRVMEAAGYTDMGSITRATPRALVDAKNPQGEAVQVEISPHGDVIREIAK